jgi:hypothetical protein
MPPTHLSEYERESLSYSEHERRFCLSREQGTFIKAYDIDVNGGGRQYFKTVYEAERQQDRRSADGIYVGSFHQRGRQIHLVLAIALKGHASFEVAVGQVKSTLEHFCQHFRDTVIDDDGARHHEQAQQQPRPYYIRTQHVVVGIVIGSSARQGTLTKYKEWPIVCLNSRQPVQDKTPLALFEEIANYTGKRFW